MYVYTGVCVNKDRYKISLPFLLSAFYRVTMSSRTTCKDKKDKFCYICGNFETETNRRTINDSIKSKYLECYKTPMKNLDKP